MIEGQAWRDVKAPDSLRERVLLGKRSGAKVALVARAMAVAVSAVALVGLAILLPQRSSAASSLDRLVEAQRNSGVLFHLLSFTITPEGRVPKIWSGYVRGNRWHYVQSDFEQAYDGIRTLTYIHGPNETFSMSELGSERGSGGILGTADLRQWKIADRKNLTLDHETKWHGHKVDMYTMRFKFRDDRGQEREGTSLLYADPKRNLPLYEEDLYSPTSGYALEWQYPDPADESLLRIDIPAGTPVREVKRSSEPLGPPEKTTNVGGR